LLDAAHFHRGGARGQSITREQLLAGVVKQMCQKKGDSKWVGMTSEVLLDDGTTAHIPLLSFRGPHSPHKRKLVAEVAKRLLPGGAVILESGASYHVYGRNTMPAKCLMTFLGKALLFAKIIDHRYVAHQVIDGRCTLRLSAHGANKSAPLSVQVV
jgi:hypothetical protein